VPRRPNARRCCSSWTTPRARSRIGHASVSPQRSASSSFLALLAIAIAGRWLTSVCAECRLRTPSLFRSELACSDDCLASSRSFPSLFTHFERSSMAALACAWKSRSNRFHRAEVAALALGLTLAGSMATAQQPAAGSTSAPGTPAAGTAAPAPTAAAWPRGRRRAATAGAGPRSGIGASPTRGPGMPGQSTGRARSRARAWRRARRR